MLLKSSYLFLLQPLHVGFTGDLGGTILKVHWYRKKTNLHHVRASIRHYTSPEFIDYRYLYRHVCLGYIYCIHMQFLCCTFSLLQVWDTLIIDTAVKTFYGSDLSTMVRAIQRNITVRRTKHSIFWFFFLPLLSTPMETMLNVIIHL